MHHWPPYDREFLWCLSGGDQREVLDYQNFFFERRSMSIAKSTKIFTCMLLTLGLLAILPRNSWAQAQDQPAASPSKPPNILFILVDDQSPQDLRIYNPQSELQTPNIDRLAVEGMVIDGARHMGSWSGAVCTASRHMLMTGRTLWHVPDGYARGKDNPHLSNPQLVPPDLAEHTLPAVFNRAGYRTMRTCKEGNSYEAANAAFQVRREATRRGDTDDTGSPWHANQVLDFLENRQATADTAPFLIYFGFSHPHDTRDGFRNLLDKYGATNHDDPNTLPSLNAQQPALPTGYLPEHPFPIGHPKLRDEVAVSGVWERRDEATIRNELGREFACSELIDSQIGRVLKQLESMGELDNTYVFYTSDHGMAIGRHGLQGKQNLYEHTWRVPFVARGPGITPGSRAPGNFYLLDLLATLCDVAGIAPPASNEGLSFRRVLQGQTDSIRDTLYGCYCGGTKPGIRSVVQGDWKLIQYDALNGRVQEQQLFNLRDNPHEFLAEHHDDTLVALTGQQPTAGQENLAYDPRYAEQLAAMEELLLQHMRELDDPYRLWNQPFPAEQQQQQIERTEVTTWTTPALVGRALSPLIKFEIETRGKSNPLWISEISGQLAESTSTADLASLSLIATTNDDLSRGTHLATFNVSPQNDAQSAVQRQFKLTPQPVPLVEGLNQFWLVAQLSPAANLDHRVSLSLEQLKYSNGKMLDLSEHSVQQRMALPLRDAGDDGVHTYRIPGLATTRAGTLLAVYDIRRSSGGDLPGDIDVGLSRSTDGGHHWEPMRVIMDMGADPQWQYDGIGDPAILVDAQTSTIWVAATWSHGQRAWHGSGPGLTPEETGQLMLVRSDDDGQTWSRPLNITEQVKRPEWSFVLQGPGKGITMHDGTLVFAAQYQDPPSNKRQPHSTIIYSRDHGQSWHVGLGAHGDTTEAQVVELEPGVLMLNCRYDLAPARVVMTSSDLGKSWQEHATSKGVLIEPGACMASLIGLGSEAGEPWKEWLLFSNPASLAARQHLTIKASPDRGQTWPSELSLLLDQGRSAGYSCMTIIDPQTIGILYEGSRSQLVFQRVPLSDVTGLTGAEN